jgi:hypothetical protein
VPNLLQRLLAYLRVDGAASLRALAQAAVIVALACAAPRAVGLVTRRIERRATGGTRNRQDEAQHEQHRRITHAFDEEGIAIPVLQRIVPLTGAMPAGLPRA